MGNARMIVSNAGPLIHLTKIGRLNLLKELFKSVVIPKTVKIEVIERGKERGAPDAFLIITKEEALEGLQKLTKVMWLSVDVYEDARKTIEGLR